MELRNTWLCAAILLSCTVLSYASENPFLIVDKQVHLKRVKDVEEVSVTITIYNAGTSTAYDVALFDDTWPAPKFALKKGNVTATWDKLSAEADVEHAYSLTTSEPGLFQPPAASVTYRMTSKPTLQTVVSTPLAPLDILSTGAPEDRLEKYRALAAKYGPAVGCVSGVTFVLWMILREPKKSSAASKKRR